MRHKPTPIFFQPPVYTILNFSPMLWVSLGLLLGIFSASYIPLPAYGGVSLMLAAMFLAFWGLYKRIKGALLVFWALAVASFSLGFVRSQSVQPDFSKPDFITSYIRGEGSITLIGIVTLPPEERDQHINLVVRAQQVRLPDSVEHFPVRGNVLVRVTDFQTTWGYGDRVVLTGQLQLPPEGDNGTYRTYLEHKGIYAYMPWVRISRLGTDQGSPMLGAIYSFQQQVLKTIYQLYPDPDASLLAGILVGIETGIPYQLQEAFQKTGTSHIIAISGFNITILAAIFVMLFQHWLGKGWGTACAVIAIGFYAVLVGGDAPVVRAALMGVVGLLGRRLNRPMIILNGMAFVAALMAFLAPNILVDVGFQLSFMATLGLVLYAQPLENWFVTRINKYLPKRYVRKVAGPFTEYVLLTFAAQLTTLPLLIYYFRRFSVISFLVNPLILPVQPPLMIFGGITVLIGMIWLGLGSLLAIFSQFFLRYTIRIVEESAAIPGGDLPLGEIAPYVVIGIYILIFGITWIWPRVSIEKRKAWLFSPIVMICMVLLVTFLWRIAIYRPDGKLHLILLETGMGDTLLIKTPTGRNVLIGGGESTIALSESLGLWLPPLNRDLDFLIVASPADQHIEAAARILDRFPPANVLWSGSPNSSSSSKLLQEKLVAAKIPIYSSEPGQILEFGQDAKLEVVGVGKLGGIFMIRWENFLALLPIGLDLDTFTPQDLIESTTPVNVLLVPANGHQALNPTNLIAHLNPQLALLSTLVGNKEGLPHPETQAVYESYSLIDTAEHGWIHITTDGDQMWVETER